MTGRKKREQLALVDWRPIAFINFASEFQAVVAVIITADYKTVAVDAFRIRATAFIGAIWPELCTTIHYLNTFLARGNRIFRRKRHPPHTSK